MRGDLILAIMMSSLGTEEERLRWEELHKKLEEAKAQTRLVGKECAKTLNKCNKAGEQIKTEASKKERFEAEKNQLSQSIQAIQQKQKQQDELFNSLNDVLQHLTEQRNALLKQVEASTKSHLDRRDKAEDRVNALVSKIEEESRMSSEAEQIKVHLETDIQNLNWTLGGEAQARAGFEAKMQRPLEGLKKPRKVTPSKYSQKVK